MRICRVRRGRLTWVCEKTFVTLGLHGKPARKIESRTTTCRRNHRRTIADPCGRGDGKDARDYVSDGEPDCQGDAGGSDPGGDLHEQSCGRDADAGDGPAAARGSAAGEAVDFDVSLAVRAAAAARGGERRAAEGFCDLR